MLVLSGQTKEWTARSERQDLLFAGLTKQFRGIYLVPVRTIPLFSFPLCSSSQDYRRLSGSVHLFKTTSRAPIACQVGAGDAMRKTRQGFHPELRGEEERDRSHTDTHHRHVQGSCDGGQRVGSGVEWGRAVSTQAGGPEETSSKKGRRPKDEEG